MNYTKGTWRVLANPMGRFIDIFGDAGLPVATILNLGNLDKDRINANLIAAAPEMYEALKDIIDQCPMPTLPYGRKVVELAKAALAKAEGKEA